ncbi:MAG: acyl carrier protein [Ignavibacteriales bacterium]|jgi:acyl carrier protein|nr:acyl carrier protein [Ignavibacteriales bacterium]MBK8663562.1 acyl carrier protein [Ignavibacteriales bacterium]MBP9124148.1 acyl carrier protein [Ignavibacteriaceae bacterium]MCC6636595.1 acyl carrier protein [Ignavibacteriaceae bacterium]
MDLQKFVANFESAIGGVKPGSLNPGTVFHTDIEYWDSLATLSVLAMIDMEYNTSIRADELIECKTIEDVFNLAISSAD